MSWGFLPGEYYFDENTRTIVHTKVKKIFDVSAVSIPANDTTDIHNKIMQLDNFIKQYSDKMKTSNMKESLTYPVYELSFYEKVIKETADYYYKQGSITKKEIEDIEEKYKDEKSAVKKRAETLRHDFLKAVFE